MGSHGEQNEVGNLKIWEVVVAAPAIALFVLLATQYNFVFYRASGGITSDDIWPVLLAMTIASLIVVLSKPWNQHSKYGSHLRMASLVLSVWSFLFMAACLIPLSRYKIIRYEVMNRDFHISAYKDLRKWQLCRDVTDPDVGPYILKDEPLMQAVVAKCGRDLIDSAPTAKLLFAGLRRSGISFDDLFSQKVYSHLLLGVVLSSTEPQPWSTITWAQEEFTESPDLSTMTESQAQAVVSHFLEKLPDLDVGETQALVFCLFLKERLFTSVEREKLIEAWSKQFQKLEALAVEGLLVRDSVKKFLGTETIETVSIRTTGLNPAYFQDRVSAYSIPTMVLGLLRSCGAYPKLLDNGPGELEIQIDITSLPLYEYEKPVYRFESYNERTQAGYGKYGPRSRTVTKQRQVQTGTETATQYAPMIEVTLTRGERTLTLPKTLLYWRHLTFDKENNRFPDIGKEDGSGRMWPVGLEERVLKAHLVD